MSASLPRRAAWAVVVAVVLSSSALGAAPPRRVAIAAAADLRFALEVMIPEFRRLNPDIDPAVSYGSSGTLFAQIVNQAPFDLFLSADTDYPNRLRDQGFARDDAVFTYAVGHLVVWVPARSPIDSAQLTLAGMAAPSVAHVAIANPEHAPYGRAAMAALRSAGLADRIGPKLVYADNVAQALQFAQSGAADAGIIALSLAIAPPVVDTGRYALIPPASYPKMDQGGIVIKSAEDPAAALAFRSFLLGQEGRAILKRFGFYTEP